MRLYHYAAKFWARNEIHFRAAPSWLVAWLVIAAFNWNTAPCRGEDSKPDVGLPSKWITSIPFDPRTRLNDVDPSVEMRRILEDRQVNALINESFIHVVRQVLTPSGVQNGSHISVRYDPSFQSLTFHWARIWRGTNFVNRLNPDKIQVSQPGLDTDEFLFSAEKSAVLLLEDVRVGDIIDYAYSVEGVNPVLADNFSDSITLQSTVPIDRFSARLLWPTNRLLYVQNHGTDLKYTALRRRDAVEFRWNLKGIPAWRDEPPLPRWYQPFPWVQLSEFRRWADVNQWALRAFSSPAPLSIELNRQIKEWKRLPGKEEQVLAALRFVQDEIRYLGMEDGAGGYKPEAPSAVFAQRFGDCKGKSLLLVTILRGLGIEAYPALVNTTYRKTLPGLHPSATVFDHCIAQVILDGQSFWLDATANYQRGPLASRSWPDYGCGLVIKPGTTALTPIAPSSFPPRTTVTEYLTLGTLQGNSQLKVVTVAEGRDAEWLRQEYATTARDEIERNHLNYYSRFYHDIAPSDHLVFTDDDQQNKIEVDEFYTIRNIWSLPPGNSFAHCQIYSHNVESALAEPALTLQRTMPLGVTYPRHEIFRAEVTLPPLAIIKPDDQTVENPAFYFHRNVSVAAGKVYLFYEYRALADMVEPQAVPNYVRQIRAASDLLGYDLSSQ